MAAAIGEFDLIARIRARATTRDDVVLGIGDDAAVLRVPAGHHLVVSTDTLGAGVHFPAATRASDIGWKALAVNLSDLAAMGAQPAWCTLNLTMPEADAAWLDAFLDGFLALAASHGIALVGGDTTRGPLSITVTVHGLVPHGNALLRRGAQVGDEVWVSGTLGDAAAALHQWREGSAIDAALRERLDRPMPRVALGLALRGIATACIDVSDGLVADLGHVLLAGGVGATVEPGRLPASPALILATGATSLLAMQLGGDDYELCFTAPPSRALHVLAAAAHSGVAATRIGGIEREQGLRWRGADGVVCDASRMGYRHFDPAHEDVGRA